MYQYLKAETELVLISQLKLKYHSYLSIELNFEIHVLLFLLNSTYLTSHENNINFQNLVIIIPY